MIPLLLVSAWLAQDPAAEVRAAEGARAAVIAAAMPAVCSIMGFKADGGGSGVVFDPLGFVLTNYHVVGKEKSMKVGLPDGFLYKGAVLGVDPGSDLAVVLLEKRAEGQVFPFAPLGDSNDLLAGESVFAMGNPFLLATDFKPTVTAGIVSGTHRYQPGQGDRMLVYPDCIQVDAPVNPGNSGGPLFNTKGEIVGINGRISVGERGRVNVGVGFAIASHQIRNFLADLMAGRHAEHGTLDMNAWYMEAPSEKGRRGVFVQALLGDSIVAKYGVGLGDEITLFNGTEVRSANQLASLVGVLPAESEVTLGFRPRQEDERGYGAPKLVSLRLARLDTGSSGDPDRIATDEQRKLAAIALTRGVGTSGGAQDGVTVVHEGARVLRRADQLRVERDGAVWVRTGEQQGFKLVGANAIDLTAEEHVMLARVLHADPWLWQGDALRQHLKDALLQGGCLVRGKPVHRVQLAGDGEREMWFFRDGTPAGYRYRDPVKKEIVELKDEPKLEAVPAESLFVRPGA